MKAANGFQFDSMLVVDDETQTSAVLSLCAARLGVRRVSHAASLRAGLELLSRRPTVLVTEACLPDGNCQPLVRAARAASSAAAVIVISDRASRRLVADVLQSGADLYLEKPVGDDEFCRSLGLLANAADLCRLVARRLVGRMGLKEAQLCLRAAMSDEALVRTRGSRRAAASLLGVNRRYVQRLADEQAESSEPLPSVAREAEAS